MSADGGPNDSPASEAVTRSLGTDAGFTLSHYKILGRLGAGGMGVVYKAEDQRLNRLVAIKLLAPEVGTGDTPEAQFRRGRFIHEAQAASALDHPHLANIHEIDETPDGQVFIVMAFYDGESLKDRLARGPLPMDEAVTIVEQVARGLAAAHAHGIVHRDIKPANVMVTTDGVAKIIDFGLAKLENVASLTQSGTTVGTVAYMSPEQARGEAVDARTDLWSLGVVFYQMLTGRLPFRGDRQGSMIRAILEDSPKPLAHLRADVPEALQAIVARALEKDPARRYASADEIVRDLEQYRARLAMPPAAEPVGRRLARAVRRPVVAVPAVLALLALGFGVYRLVDRLLDFRWARQVAIPQVIELAKQQEYTAAFDLARQAERYLGDDPVLQQIWEDVAGQWTIESTPPGADIYVRNARSNESRWEFVGRSNSGPLRVPKGLLHASVRKAGSIPTERMIHAQSLPRRIHLDEEGNVPADMVRVQAGGLIQSLSFPSFQALDSIYLGEFLIDRFEVTNRAYKAFVDDGAYKNTRFWKHPFVDQGDVIPWKEAMLRFVDKTGRSGPATWEYGRYPDGQDAYPVTGVSWYEAAAYAESVGKILPTVYHWAVAAQPNSGEFTLPLSNLGTSGLAPVGRYRGSLNPLGLYDTAGNAREWGLNATGESRFVLGAAWNDGPYLFNEPVDRPAFDRSPETGFRCMQAAAPDAVPEASLDPVPRIPPRDWSRQKGWSDAEFAVWMSLFSDPETPLNAKRELRVDSPAHWVIEKISFDAIDDEQRMIVYLLLPETSSPPYQAVVYWPGANAISQRTSNDGKDLFGSFRYEHLLTDGRAVVYPILKWTHERGGGRRPIELFSFEGNEADRLGRHIREIRRTLDYLATRPDIDSSHLAYLGASWGAYMGVVVLATEPRFKAGILMSGGFRGYSNVFGFAQRVRTPVQMINGRFDGAFPLETSSKPMFRALGTPATDKRHEVLDGFHSLANVQDEVIRLNLAWLDRYLGPVQRRQ